MRNLLRLLALYVGVFYVVEDAAGAADDLGDFVVDDGVEAPEEATTDNKEKIETPDDPPDAKPEEDAQKEETEEEKAENEEIAALKAEIEALKADQEDVKSFVTKQQVEEAVRDETNKLMEQYPDFDIESVGAYLNDLAKTDRELAEKMNNPIGWENIYLKQEIESGRGEFIPARGVSKEPFDVKKATEKAERGDESAQIALLYGNS